MTEEISGMPEEPGKGWVKGDDGRTHCPCCFAAEKRAEALQAKLDRAQAALRDATVKGALQPNYVLISEAVEYTFQGMWRKKHAQAIKESEPFGSGSQTFEGSGQQEG